MNPKKRRAILDQYRQACDFEPRATDEELEQLQPGKTITGIVEDHGDHEVLTTTGQSRADYLTLENFRRALDA